MKNTIIILESCYQPFFAFVRSVICAGCSVRTHQFQLGRNDSKVVADFRCSRTFIDFKYVTSFRVSARTVRNRNRIRFRFSEEQSCDKLIGVFIGDIFTRGRFILIAQRSVLLQQICQLYADVAACKRRSVPCIHYNIFFVDRNGNLYRHGLTSVRRDIRNRNRHIGRVIRTRSVNSVRNFFELNREFSLGDLPCQFGIAADKTCRAVVVDIVNLNDGRIGVRIRLSLVHFACRTVCVFDSCCSGKYVLSFIAINCRSFIVADWVFIQVNSVQTNNSITQITIVDQCFFT